jgi:putative lipoic acid-binding regulatory protein
MSALPPDPARQATLLEFPCDFPIKVVGRREDGFAQAVSEIVQRHAGDFAPSTLEMRASRNARFLSLTATITARSKDQLDALYRELSGHPLVMMVL